MIKKRKGSRKYFVFICLWILLLAFLVVSLLFMKLGIVSITGFAVYESPSDGSTTYDTYIRGGMTAENNYGNSATLRVGNISSTTQYRSIIKFNISSIDPANTITSAKLQTYQETHYGSSDITITAYRLTSDWVESEASWNNMTFSSQWGAAGGDYGEEIASVIFSNFSGNYYNFSIDVAVRGWVNGTYANYGIILISSDAAEGNYTYLSSSESSIESQRPKIIIDYTENAVPLITGISTGSSLSSPKQVGQQMSITVNWTDYENDAARMFVCNSSSVDSFGCADYTLCNGSLGYSPSSCNYSVSSSDNRTTNFYVAVCDSNCSEAGQSSFYVNHAPYVLVTRPNGGETVNQSQGNYRITFNVSDSDNDLLVADLYYGAAPGSTDHLIFSNMNLTKNCTDPDSHISTANNCSSYWNSTGVYGSYYLTIIVNDSYSASNDSSDATFNARSLVDNENPKIDSHWTDADIYSGKITNFYANITEENINTVWLSINNSFQNFTMQNLSSATYNFSWTAIQTGTYSYKIYANDTVGNINNTMSWQSFTIRKPNAASQNEYSPAASLPYHLIKITGQINASDAVRGIYAYLNVPQGFTFLSDYPQNSPLGNFTENETKTVTWFVSVPLSEANYTLNITYTDGYSNLWQSSDFYVRVTSDIGGGYLITVSGYPEAETGYNYFVQAFFTNSGTYASADFAYVSIYDSTGSLVVGPASMNNPSAGIYNYTYAVGSSVNEGQWETIVNATKSGASYFASEFFRVVGGPFDIRGITIIDSSVDSLNISVIAENTGGANKDLTLVWNLTRADNNEILDSGSETFRVNANSEKTWYINASTSYLGQVKITFIGHYSGTEKAGAYKIFSTTSGNETPITPSQGSSGGAGSAITKTNKSAAKEETIVNFTSESVIYLSKNIEKIIISKVHNTGALTLTNISLYLKGIGTTEYLVSPASINSLKPGESKDFQVKFLIQSTSGENDFDYVLKYSGKEEAFPGKIIVLSMKDYFLDLLEKIKARSNLLKSITEDENILSGIFSCEKIIGKLESDISAESFLDAQDTHDKASGCLSEIEKKIRSKKGETKIMSSSYTLWIAMILIMLILLAGIIFLAYKVYKKLGIISFLRKQEAYKSKEITSTKKMRQNEFEERIKKIEDKLVYRKNKDDTKPEKEN
jgi:hypothetical protein